MRECSKWQVYANFIVNRSFWVLHTFFFTSVCSVPNKNLRPLRCHVWTSQKIARRLPTVNLKRKSQCNASLLAKRKRRIYVKGTVTWALYPQLWQADVRRLQRRGQYLRGVATVRHRLKRWKQTGLKWLTRHMRRARWSSIPPRLGSQFSEFE